jgi:hypothetical protein
MKKDNVSKFITEHKQSVPEDGFSTRLLNTLDALPQPKMEKDRKPMIIGVFTGIGVLLFVLLGGYGILLKGMESIGLVFGGVGHITPEIITTFLVMTIAFAALIRFADRPFER